MSSVLRPIHCGRVSAQNDPVLPEHIRAPLAAFVLRACEELWATSAASVPDASRTMNGMSSVLNSISLLVHAAIASFRTTVNSRAPVMRLPNELLYDVADYVYEREDHLNMRRTCSVWRESLDRQPSLWSDIAWKCIPRTHPDIDADLVILDFWLSLTNKTILGLEAPQVSNQLLQRGGYPCEVWPLYPYMELLYKFGHRITHLYLGVDRTNHYDALAFIPCMPALEALSLRCADTVISLQPRLARASDIFRAVNETCNGLRLKKLHFRNVAFDVPPPQSLFRCVNLVTLEYCEYSVFDPAWIGTALTHCTSLKQLEIGVDCGIADWGSFTTIAPKHVIEDITIRAGSDVTQRLLKYLHHPRRSSITVLEDALYSLFDDVRDCTSLFLLRLATNSAGGLQEECLSLKCEDGRGCSRTIRWITQLFEGDEELGVDRWGYRDVWDVISTTQLHTIHVQYSHWHRLSHVVQLPALQTLVVTVLPEDAAVAAYRKRHLLNLGLVRFETQVKGYWSALGTAVVTRFVVGLTTSSTVKLRVELDRWTRLESSDLELLRMMPVELVEE
ncbi:hypothetical protein EXIGLDRAFT_839643 [Exidia glandulosa HHB12029]|uniref:F-box domain-containing protein n=1 Tax=Exidia glandulosa HHB12029 TaxID=1314781 RepID=A0A165EWG9_EXIGL|nr:hypothetical protein EXIGLDRAFT_839643 [Exidia glandulosa HHB12029]